MADKKSSEEKLITYKCMNCFSEMSVSNRKKLSIEGKSCFLCNGPITKVKRKLNVGQLTVDVDVTDAIKGLKAVQREARKTTQALRELEEQKKNKYLSIELDELGDVPRVFYKGEKITMKKFVNFQWTTRSDVPGSTDIIVDYYEKNLEEGKFISKSIRESVES